MRFCQYDRPRQVSSAAFMDVPGGNEASLRGTIGAVVQEELSKNFAPAPHPEPKPPTFTDISRQEVHQAMGAADSSHLSQFLLP